MNILSRYVLSEFIPPALMGVVVFTFVLILDRIFELTRMVVTRGVALATVLTLVWYILPSLIVLSAPAALLAGTLLCFGRLSADNEISAIRGSGISLMRVIMPVLVLVLVISLFLVRFNGNTAPTSLFKFRNLYSRILYKHPALKLEEHTFLNVDDYRIYVEKIKRRGSLLSGIVVYRMTKDRLPTLINAKEGMMESKGQIVTLHLFDGNIQERDTKNADRCSITNFKNYAIVLSAASKNPNITKRIREMNQKELREEIKKMKNSSVPETTLLVEYHQRIVFAVAGIVFCLVGAPLGIKLHAKGKSVGFGLSLILIFLYYFLLAVGITLGDRKLIEPRIGMWIPNILFAVTGCVLIYITAKK